LFIAALVFVMRLAVSWMHSDYENYDNSVNESKSSVCKGSFFRQIALGGLDLFGLAAIACSGGKRLRIKSVMSAMGVALIAWRTSGWQFHRTNHGYFAESVSTIDKLAIDVAIRPLDQFSVTAPVPHGRN
jgi:hypothetical protein